MAKLVKLFLIFGPVQGTIKVITKYANPGQTIDESLMSTLCLPKIELVHEPGPPRFQTFLVTKEDGQVLYGSGLIVHDRHSEPPAYPGAGRYASYCYTIITDTPFITATRSLLQLIWEKKCDDIIIKSIMNIPLPPRRKCLRIVAPLLTTTTTTSTSTTKSSNNCLVNSHSQNQKQQLDPHQRTTKGKHDTNPSSPSLTSSFGNSNNNNRPSKEQKVSNSNFINCGPSTRTIDDIYLYRGMTDLPLLDYPLRELFNFLHIDDFLLAYACLLMEFRTLIISKDNYKLMMVGETLTSLLLPLKWCNVYVPILPPVYGATYLDAPTSYIMGINTQVTELPENLNHIQCRIYCDESRVVCDADSLALPLFLNDIKRDILCISSEFHGLSPSAATRSFTYLEDLKFNRAIRMLFIKTIRKNILANYERYIVDVPEASSDIRQFDVVSYLSDQDECMRSFLSKFLDTQLFACFIDENAKRIQQSWLSVFDMEPEELSEHFSDKALEQAFQTAQRIHLMDLRQDCPSDIEIKTVPASPMKLRKRMPALSSLASRLTFSRSGASRSTSIECSSSAGSPPGQSPLPIISSSPPIHRNSVATVSLGGHLALVGDHQRASVRNPYLMAGGGSSTNDKGGQLRDADGTPTSLRPNNAPISQPVPNGKIVELINEVKDLTKRILIELMGDVELVAETTGDTPDSAANRSSAQQTTSGGSGLTRFGSNSHSTVGQLCDLVERVWAHGAFAARQGAQDNTASCPLWNHLLAFARLKYLDTKPQMRQDFADGSHLNVLSPKSEINELDMMLVQQQQKQNGSNNVFRTFNLFKPNNRTQQIGPMARDLINDLGTILTLKDVKTDVGKARAFIRLSLERKKLSKHLKTLLSDQTLLASLYKPYAFLRCEEEREQFLMYLLTLNAVDLPCFTTTFASVIEMRQMNNKTAATA